MKTIYVDVETSGLDAQNDQITELAAVYEDDNGKKSVFNMYCKLPEGKTLDPKVIEITGITDEMLKAKGVSEKKLYTEFIAWIRKLINPYDKKDKAIFSAYNAAFDCLFLRELFKRNDDNYFGSWFYSCVLDVMATVAIAKQLGVFPDLVNYKLKTVADYMGVKLEKAHSALHDIQATIHVHKTLIKTMAPKERMNYGECAF